jgi:hypothetical protein
MSLPTHITLEDKWPVLDSATPCSDAVFDAIKTAADGEIITTKIGYLSLGNFYIPTSLLESHPTQRTLNKGHVANLKQAFINPGIHRDENPGVIIGLGDGWNMMKNSGPLPYMIPSTWAHLSQLSKVSDGPIGQVICGGHRTEAIKQYSDESNNPEENYWLFTILISGKS